ncbi:MAG: hypothetical protein U9Q97_00160 [Acidobacteriota bacterium]|nr:hypothetical protein [Acidobacteriota bacterium]
MRKTLTLMFIISMAFTAGLFAQDSGLGAGIILGEPTGISVKYWTGNTTAFDGAVAWSFANKAAVHLHLDMLYHKFNIINISKGSLPVYYGLGARLKLEEKSRVGVRIPVGIAYHFETAPVDVFFEIVPLLDLVPETDFGLNSAIGVRYYF